MSLAPSIDFVKRVEQLELSELVVAGSGVTAGLGPVRDLSLIVEVDDIFCPSFSVLVFFLSDFLLSVTGIKFCNVSKI